MTLSEIADLLFTTVGVHEAELYQVEKLQEYRSTRVSGGGWNHAHKRGRHFRVGVTTEKGKQGNAEHPSVSEAITVALTGAGIPVPAWVKTTADFEKNAKTFGPPTA